MSNKLNLIILFSKQLISPIINRMKKYHFRKINSINDNYYLVRLGKLYINFEQKYLNYFFNSNLKISDYNNKKFLEVGINFYYSFLFYSILVGLGFSQIYKIYQKDFEKIQIKNDKFNNLNYRLDKLLKNLE